MIDRSALGVVKMTCTQNDTEIMYSINGGAPQKYQQPFDFKQGGTVTAWPKGNKMVSTSLHLDKMSNIPVKILFCSSEENKAENTPATNLIDGNIETFWHTMYSVTMANYPHWIDFDCYETKSLTGFSYTPRQDSPNGNIRDYEIYVSQDGKNWGKCILKGTFENNRQQKKISFEHPVKARYLRFKALSSQNGQDFASGAEFSIMAE